MSIYEVEFNYDGIAYVVAENLEKAIKKFNNYWKKEFENLDDLNIKNVKKLIGDVLL